MSLRIDLAPIRQQLGKVVPFSLTVDHLPYLPEGCKVYDDLSFFGNFSPKRNTIDVSGNVQAELVCSCSRCLKPLLFDFNLPVQGQLLFRPESSYVMEPGMDEGDLEAAYWIYDTSDYDFSFVVADTLINALPIRPLCGEACKGLCPHCGQNLNEGSCQCETETIDPRWLALKESLKNEEV